MDSRTRVLRALEHKEPDRIPIDLGGMRSSGIMAIAYANLKRYLGINEGEIRVYDMCQQLAEPEEWALNRFNVDVIDVDRTLPPAYPKSSVTWVDWTLPDGTPCKIPSDWYPSIAPVTVMPWKKGEGKLKLVKENSSWLLKWGNITWERMSENSVYFSDTYHPLEKAESTKDIDEFFEKAHDPEIRYPYLLTKEDVEGLRAKAKYLYENTDYALMAGFGGNFTEAGEFLLGYTKFLSYIMLKRNFIEYLFDKLLEYYKANLKLWLGAVKDYAQIAVFGDDFGTQAGPKFSPRVYREVVKPRASELYKYVKKSSNMYVFLHSCGSIYELLPEIIDAGVEVLNPVQISARNMEPEKLKREFGDEIVFWGGGVDTQNVLWKGTPKDVRKNVIENVSVFAPGGGFIFATVHNITARVPPENILAVYEALEEHGNYPIG